MFDGIINVYKESGFTSFDVVAKLRGILKQKRIGHTGTLDPMAEGVLMVCLGKATKLVDMLTEGDKVYRATMKLGIETDTEDITGAVVRQSDVSLLAEITDEHIIDTIMSYTKSYDQIPPMYSAIKKDGKKLYEYAREGIEVEREPRRVTIYKIDNIEGHQDQWSFDIHCSKGTYIRSLLRDIGRNLGCYATMSALTRLDVHGYSVEDSFKLNEIEKLVQDGKFDDILLPVDSLLMEYPVFQVNESGKRYLSNGNKLSKNFLMNMESDEIITDNPERIRVYMDGVFVALYDYNAKEQIYKPYKMFLG